MDKYFYWNKAASQESEDGDAPLVRSIPAGHQFNPESLKPLSKTLWTTQVALTYALTAYREFAKLHSSDISPDGLLGGKGYILPVRSIRDYLQQVCEALSSISDTLHDEIQGPHWNAPFENSVDQDDVNNYLEEAELIRKDPFAPVEDASKSIEKEPNPAPGTKFKGLDYPDADNSGLPEGDVAEYQATNKPFGQDDYLYSRQASSELPFDAVHTFPKITTKDRGDVYGPESSFNSTEVPGAVEFDMGLREPLYQYDYRSMAADAQMPDGVLDKVRVDVNDFGLGYGGTGGAQQDQTEDKPGTGLGLLWAPAAGLPDDPGGLRTDPNHEDAQPYQYNIERGIFGHSSELPDDGIPVSRSDYYEGPKGNIVSDEKDSLDVDRDLLGIGYQVHQYEVPYVSRNDQSTREDVEGKPK